VATPIRAYVRSLGLDAYVVGGSVRDQLLGLPHDDEDFLVVGVDHDGLRALLEPHGRVEEMEVHGQRVGVRLHPSDPALRRLAPKGIELTPPRAERSTGPGHRDFAIVADPGVTLEEDMGRRDFTINAIALHLVDGLLVDPFGGRADLEAGLLRTVSPTSFAEDPLRILRGLRLVSQLGFTLADETLAQMRAQAPALAHVSAERIGGGLAADGRGELSRLLLGRDPVTALRLARDTGVLAVVLPELTPGVGFDLGSPRQPATLDEHVFAVVGRTAARGAGLEVRLAALLHDVGKPETRARGGDHAELAAVAAAGALERLRYPTACIRHVRALVAAHSFRVDPWLEEGDTGPATRRFLARHGERLAAELVLHKRCDLETKVVDPAELEAVDRLERELREQQHAPHRLADLAVDGDDLLALGIERGPAVGAVLRALLERVVDDPALNERERLLELVGEVRA
jgi:tRNA nucleotidyltransferase (CCA-adding enzyme)